MKSVPVCLLGSPVHLDSKLSPLPKLLGLCSWPSCPSLCDRLMQHFLQIFLCSVCLNRDPEVSWGQFLPLQPLPNKFFVSLVFCSFFSSFYLKAGKQKKHPPGSLFVTAKHLFPSLLKLPSLTSSSHLGPVISLTYPYSCSLKNLLEHLL